MFDQDRITNDFIIVAREVSEDVNGHQCQKRWQDTVEPNIKRGNWSPEEDNLLRSAVEAFGTSWQNVSLFVPGRTNNQCRERWQDRLSVTVKGKWTSEEDETLIKTVNELGRSSWKRIADKMGNRRSGEMVKFHYFHYWLLMKYFLSVVEDTILSQNLK